MARSLRFLVPLLGLALLALPTVASAAQPTPVLCSVAYTGEGSTAPDGHYALVASVPWLDDQRLNDAGAGACTDLVATGNFVGVSNAISPAEDGYLSACRLRRADGVEAFIFGYGDLYGQAFSAEFCRGMEATPNITVIY